MGRVGGATGEVVAAWGLAAGAHGSLCVVGLIPVWCQPAFQAVREKRLVTRIGASTHLAMKYGLALSQAVMMIIVILTFR